MFRRSIAVAFLAAVALGVAIIPTPSGMVAPAEAAQPVPAEPGKHAVLVAVNNYANTGFSSLHYAVSDIEKLEAVLRKSGFSVVTVLTNKNATRKAIEEAVRSAAEKRKEGEVLLLAMSGHGVQFLNAKGKEDAYFCPADVDKDKDETMVSLTAAVTALGNRGPNLVLIDACRDDPKKGVSGNELRGVLQAKTAVLLSCSAGQSSFETNRMYKDRPGFNPVTTEGHGVFFYHVLRALEGEAKDDRGRVTWSRMMEYVAACNVNAKAWLPDEASRTARRLGVPVSDLSLQDPQAISNLPLAVNPVLVPVSRDLGSVGGPKAGEERSFEIADGVKMVFCWVPAGEAQLGSPKAERDAVWEQVVALKLGDASEKSVRELLESEAMEKRGKFRTKGFWLGKFTVTQEEWQAVMGDNPSYFDGKKDNKAKGLDTHRFPVENVSWDMICKGKDCFLTKLNARGGMSKVFGQAGRFALPHEDQWEYACRGGKGNDRAYYWGTELNGTQANCNSNYPFGSVTKGPQYLERTCAVDFTNGGRYEKHPWGLFHMSGNVYQWCSNMYDSKTYVLRGGSWSGSAGFCRSAFRSRSEPDSRDLYVGFRVCLPLEK